MHLIFLYGAPGTGKYTIAKKLADKTGFTFLHNHIILNALSEIFGFDHPIRKRLEKEFRLRIVEEAVNANINLIMTGVIMRDNEAFYRRLLHTVEEAGGRVSVVRLTASDDTLEKRIENKQRKVMNKISSVERLRKWIKQYPESLKEINYPNQKLIDTNIVSVSDIVGQITKLFNI